jgi:hypothetical protein
MKCCDENNQKASKVENQNLDELICYCFEHSKKELYEAIQKGKEQEIINDIKSKMINPGCFCETANPSGKCCLSDIKQFIKFHKEN